MAVRKFSDYMRSMDWWTVALFFILVFIGWFTIYAASFNFEETSIFDFETPSGKQFVWISLALLLIGLILSLDVRIYMFWAPAIYVVSLIVLLVTIFIAPDIKGSHSWLEIGSLRVQPAEFGKTATALMLAWLFNTYNFKFLSLSGFLKVVLVILLPIVLIILQRETGSALVYFSFILLLYRQGMSGIVLFAAFALVLIFVLGLKYSMDMETGSQILLGQEIVLTIISIFFVGMMLFYAKDKIATKVSFIVNLVLLVIGYFVSLYISNESFNVQYRWFCWIACSFNVVYGTWLFLVQKLRPYLMVSLLTILFTGFLYSADYAFQKLDDHQRIRIEVLLGMKDDPKGAGYNVHQAAIAIGSGGFEGKGYLMGTQTKLKYVPEQNTDFIFCTIGEEEGFWGTTLVISLYGALILRLLFLAERQRTMFAQVFGYCVASIFIFHVLINVGMVIGFCPVIGIPLPFLSYGGSGMWSFTILLFIFLKLDASRIENY